MSPEFEDHKRRSPRDNYARSGSFVEIADPEEGLLRFVVDLGLGVASEVCVRLRKVIPKREISAEDKRSTYDVICEELADKDVVLQFPRNRGAQHSLKPYLIDVWLGEENFNHWLLDNGFASEFTSWRDKENRNEGGRDGDN